MCLPARPRTIRLFSFSQGYPEWIFHFNRAAWNYSTEDYSLNKEPWTDLYTEATTKRYSYNTFVYRLLLSYKCDPRMASDWCKYNMGKQPVYYFSVRNFTELQLQSPQTYVGPGMRVPVCAYQARRGPDEPIQVICNKKRFPRNQRYGRRRVVGVKTLPSKKVPPLFYTHRVFTPTEPIINIEQWANRLADFSLQADNELTRTLIFQLGAFLPKSDFDIVRKSYDIAPGFFKTHLPLDAPEDRYCWYLEGETHQTAPPPPSVTCVDACVAGRARMVLLRPVPRPWGERRSHWLPAFFTWKSLVTLVTQPDTIVLQFGKLHRTDIPTLTKHHAHYRRIVLAPSSSSGGGAAATTFAQSRRLRRQIRSTTREINCSSFGSLAAPALPPTRPLTQHEHERLRQFVTDYLRLVDVSVEDRHAALRPDGQVVVQRPNLQRCHDALCLIGRHERSILLTLLDIWREACRPRVPLSDLLTGSPHLIKATIEEFLGQWSRDLAEVKQQAQQAYATACRDLFRLVAVDEVCRLCRRLW